VVTKRNATADRKRFTLAHELGHLVMETDPIVSAREEERLANRFAAAFLVPRDAAVRELGPKRTHLSFIELRLLKEKHGLSMQAWLCRARDLGIVKEGHFNTLYASLGAYGWRRQEPGEYRGREEPAAFRQMVYRALAEGLVDQQQAERWCPELKGQIMNTGLNSRTENGFEPQRVYRLPVEHREALLREAAAALADVYGAGSSAVVGDAMDDAEKEGGSGASGQSS
jgi:hypothetical protein